jgi:phytoene synthase
MPQADSAFEAFEQKWFEAHPEYAIASIFIPPGRRRTASAFACLVHELDDAVLHVQEVQVAAAKLAWWRGELAAAADGQARHPITRELFAANPAPAATRERWVELADAALSRLSRSPAATLAELIAQHRPFDRAVVRADAALAGRDDGAADDATLWTISRLLRELPRIAQDAEVMPLPLDLLARHGLTRAALRDPGARRTDMLRDHLGALAAAMPQDRGGNLHQRIRSRLDAVLIAGARAADDPLQHLREHAAPGRWHSVWTAWREARALLRK